MPAIGEIFIPIDESTDVWSGENFDFNEQTPEIVALEEQMPERQETGGAEKSGLDVIVECYSYDPKDWQKTYSESGEHKFDAEKMELLDKEGNSLTAIIEGSGLSADKIAAHREMLQGWKENPDGEFLLPEWVEKTENGEKINITVARLEKDGSVSYETWSHFVKEKEAAEKDADEIAAGETIAETFEQPTDAAAHGDEPMLIIDLNKEFSVMSAESSAEASDIHEAVPAAANEAEKPEMAAEQTVNTEVKTAAINEETVEAIREPQTAEIPAFAEENRSKEAPTEAIEAMQPETSRFEERTQNIAAEPVVAESVATEPEKAAASEAVAVVKKEAAAGILDANSDLAVPVEAVSMESKSAQPEEIVMTAAPAGREAAAADENKAVPEIIADTVSQAESAQITEETAAPAAVYAETHPVSVESNIQADNNTDHEIKEQPAVKAEIYPEIKSVEVVQAAVKNEATEVSPIIENKFETNAEEPASTEIKITAEFSAGPETGTEDKPKEENIARPVTVSEEKRELKTENLISIKKENIRESDNREQVAVIKPETRDVRSDVRIEEIAPEMAKHRETQDKAAPEIIYRQEKIQTAEVPRIVEIEQSNTVVKTQEETAAPAAVEEPAKINIVPETISRTKSGNEELARTSAVSEAIPAVKADIDVFEPEIRVKAEIASHTVESEKKTVNVEKADAAVFAEKTDIPDEAEKDASVKVELQPGNRAVEFIYEADIKQRDEEESAARREAAGGHEIILKSLGVPVGPREAQIIEFPRGLGKRGMAAGIPVKGGSRTQSPVRVPPKLNGITLKIAA